MKVMILFATGYEEVEALAVVDILRRGGVDVQMVGVDGTEVTSSRKITVIMDQVIDHINKDTIDMLVLPGGMPGVDNLYASEAVKSLILHCDKMQKKIGAICAAPSILGKLGILKGKRATCYPGFEMELVGAEVVSERVVESSHIITGIGAGASLEFALKLLEVIRDKETMEKVKNAMLV